jgi:hypothetical protein
MSTAIAREVLNVVIDEKLVENARKMGIYLHRRLRKLLKKYPIIGDIRGRGLLAGIELVRDRKTKMPFPFNWYVNQEATEIAREKGLLIYPRRSRFGLAGDHILIAPPLIIDKKGIDECVDIFDQTLEELSALVAEHIISDDVAVHHDTLARYEPAEEVSDYALGKIDHLEPETDANVTYVMQHDSPNQAMDEEKPIDGLSVSKHEEPPKE